MPLGANSDPLSLPAPQLLETELCTEEICLASGLAQSWLVCVLLSGEGERRIDGPAIYLLFTSNWSVGGSSVSPLLLKQQLRKYKCWF